MNALVMLVLGAITYASRAASVVVLPRPRGRLEHVLARMPAPIFASLAVLSLINPDKTLVDRAAFLKQTAVPVTIKNLTAHDVKIRVLGDFAIIHAATSYTTAEGQQAHGRYTDCWAKQNGKWLAVSAHVSR